MHQGKAITRKLVLQAGWQQILEYSEQRVALILSVLDANTIYLSFSPPSAAGLGAAEGHLLDASHSPLVLADYLALRLFAGPIYAYASVANVPVYVTEVIVGEECRERLNALVR
ncbi:MAG: hypothetical protein QXI19_02730 [Candidatus Caldarchaeum sp.]